MKNSVAPQPEALSPDDVLSVIRDWYRFSEALDPESEVGADLSFDTTVVDWQSACDLLPAKLLGLALNESFGIDVSEADWLQVLQPSNRLAQVCAFISERGASRYDCSPVKIAGTECDVAGIFLSLRSLLLAAGLPVAGSRPSTPIAPFMDEHGGRIITAMAKLAPGALPIPKCRTFRPVTRQGIVVLFLLALVFLCAPNYLFPALISIGIAVWLQSVFVRKKFGSHWYFEGISTLGDLARLIADLRLRNAR